jgi:two-component sensor histidine kinase
LSPKGESGGFSMSDPVAEFTPSVPNNKRSSPWWRDWMWSLPAILVFALTGLTVLIWHLEQINAKAMAISEASWDGAKLAGSIQSLLNAAVRPTRDAWLAGQFADEQRFAATSHRRLLTRYVLWIAWVDDSGICMDLQGNSDIAKTGTDFSANHYFAELIARAAASHRRACSIRKNSTGAVVVDVAFTGADGRLARVNSPGSPADLGNAAAVEVPQPTVEPATQPGVAGIPPGVIIFELHVQQILQNVATGPVFGRYILELRDPSGQAIWKAPGPGTLVVKAEGVRDLPPLPIMMLDRNWDLHLFLTDEFLRSHQLNAPNWALWTWLAGSILLVASVWQVVYYRRHHERRLEHHLQSVESLAETSAMILSRVGSGGEVWTRLPEAASSLLGMKMSSVAVLEEGDKTLRIVASYGTEPPAIGQKFELKNIPSAQLCVTTRKPVTLPNIIESEVRPDHPNVRLISQYSIRSALMVPLTIGEKIFGVMMMSHTEPREFTDSDMRLAELWGMLAAVTIANDRLYEQTRTALAARDRLAKQREAVFSIVNELIAQHDSTEQILNRIVELAPAALNVVICQVMLLTDNPGEFIIAAMTRGFADDLIGYRFGTTGSMAGQALRRGTILTVEKGGPDNPELHPVFRKRLPCGSLLFAPLNEGVGGATIGMLILLRADPGPFSEEQQSLSQLLAVRAAMAIENARLYERTRKDADTKAMLLRELNHRVKNNLAGIVGLLSVDPPELSARARKWLNRVVDRVGTLARTHDMLSTSSERVTLNELTDQIIKSLAVVTRPKVTVRAELADPRLMLRTDRAVSLAMVLHELCFNALVHGLPESGNLLIKQRIDDDNILVLEVIDNGCGFEGGGTGVETAWNELLAGGTTAEVAARAAGENAPQPDPVALLNGSQTAPPQRGLGLNLVRGFVARELRGWFSLASTPGAGTTARVRFALFEDELTHPVV